MDELKIVSRPGMKYKVGDKVWIVKHDNASGPAQIERIVKQERVSAKPIYYYSVRAPKNERNRMYAFYDHQLAPDGKLSELLYG